VYALIPQFSSNGNIDGHVVVQLLEALHYISGSIPNGVIGIFN
jgi:hypothetical protein